MGRLMATSTKWGKPLRNIPLADTSMTAFTMHTHYQQPFYITVPDLAALEIVRVLHHTDQMVEQDQVDHRSHTYTVLRHRERAGRETYWVAVQHGGGTVFMAINLGPYRLRVIERQLLDLNDHDAFWFIDTLMETALDSYKAGRWVAFREVLKAKIAGTLKFPRKKGTMRIKLDAEPKRITSGNAEEG